MLSNNPWSIQLEMTEGCNRRCWFCGLHSIYREKADMIYKFMTPELAKQIAIDLSNWFQRGKRLEFALQGEPLLNPKAPEIIRNFRDYYNESQLMVTSNMDVLRKGPGFNAEKIWKLFKSGLNMLVCDYYGEKTDMSYENFFNEISNASSGVPVFDFYKDKPKVWGFEGNNIMKIVIIDNTDNRDIHRSLNNQAGNTSPELIQINTGQKVTGLPKMAMCQQPFRELSIKYDGAVPLCCMDWNREHIIGKFPEESFKDIWESMHMKLVRHLLFNKRRDLLSPCDRCNYHGYKVGLVNKPYPGGDGPDLEQSSIIVKTQQKLNTKSLGNKYATEPFQY